MPASGEGTRQVAESVAPDPMLVPAAATSPLSSLAGGMGNQAFGGLVDQPRRSPPAKPDVRTGFDGHDAIDIGLARAAALRAPGTAVLARDGVPEAAPPAPQGGDETPAGDATGGLTPEDNERLDNADQLILKAVANDGQASAALKAYATGAPAQFAALQQSFGAAVSFYDQAAERVNSKIEKAKELAQIRRDILLKIVDEALAGIGKQLTAHFEVTVDGMPVGRNAYTMLQQGVGEFQQYFAGFGVNPVAAGKAAVGVGGTAPSAPALTGPSWSQELNFAKMLNRLLADGNQLLPLALAAGDAGREIAKVQEAIKGIRDAGKTRSDYPLTKLEHDAAACESGTRSFAAAAPEVTGMLTNLTALAAQNQAAAPGDAQEVERELWVRWASQLGPNSRELLDETGIEDHLKKLGIWEQLGIDIGDWFSDKEEASAVASARAQELVMAHKGEALAVSLSGGQPQHQVTLEGLPPLGAIMDQSGTAGSARVRAVVVGARTQGPIDTDDLVKQASSVKGAADYLLRKGLVSVVLRAYEDLAAPAGEASGPPVP